jgi:hypothetical protein
MGKYHKELILMDFFLQVARKARREGLIAIEEIIQSIEKQKSFKVFGLIYTGLRCVIEGYDYADIQGIFDNYRKRAGFDEITFNIITQSCLAIQRGDGRDKMILSYAGLLPEKVRDSKRFLNLAVKYGYEPKYETWTEHREKQEISADKASLSLAGRN